MALGLLGRADTDPGPSAASEYLSVFLYSSRVLTLPHLRISFACRDTKASWDPLGLLDQKARRWVFGLEGAVAPHIWGRGQLPVPGGASRNMPLLSLRLKRPGRTAAHPLLIPWPTRRRPCIQCR